MAILRKHDEHEFNFHHARMLNELNNINITLEQRLGIVLEIIASFDPFTSKKFRRKMWQQERFLEGMRKLNG